MRAVVLMLIAFPAAASAHAIGADATIKGGRVHIEAYYDDDTAAIDASVLVVGDGKEVASGTTDSAGKWSFAAPPPGDYRVTVDAGAGHRVTIKVKVPNGLPASPVEERPVTEGKRREEFTRVPWQGLTVGVGALGLIAVASWAMRKR